MLYFTDGGDVQFKEFRLYFSNESNDFSEPVFEHTAGDQKYIIEIDVPNILTQYIKIERPGNVLTICEVKIYEGGMYDFESSDPKLFHSYFAT